MRVDAQVRNKSSPEKEPFSGAVSTQPHEKSQDKSQQGAFNDHSLPSKPPVAVTHDGEVNGRIASAAPLLQSESHGVVVIVEFSQRGLAGPEHSRNQQGRQQQPTFRSCMR